MIDCVVAKKRRGRRMNRVGKACIFGLCVIGAALAAAVSETVSYTYDSRGRLVKVVRTGTVNNNVTASYSYDKADNRTVVNVASPNPPP